MELSTHSKTEKWQYIYTVWAMGKKQTSSQLQFNLPVQVSGRGMRTGYPKVDPRPSNSEQRLCLAKLQHTIYTNQDLQEKDRINICNIISNIDNAQN